MIIVRKVILNMNENEKYKIIKKLVETNGNKKRAAVKLNCSIRTINRLIIKYNTEGKAGFSHKNRGKRPAIAFDHELVQKVIDLYDEKYYDANLSHYALLLSEYEDIKVSYRTLRNWFYKVDKLSPKAHRRTKKLMKKKLKERQKAAKTQKEFNKIVDKVEALDSTQSHPRRPRCKYRGEMVQMDASSLEWFNGITTHLHVAIDDATGDLVGAYFDTQETLNGYYNVLYQILTNHGIPAMFYSDKRTVFEYKKKASPLLSDDTFTQFSYACNQLGIEIKTTSVPQAKGRVERHNQTLQSRLPIELRLKGISSIEEANDYLRDTYIKKYNDEFALHLNSTKTVYETQPSKEKINRILARIDTRVIDAGHSIKYKHNFYALRTKMGLARYFPRGTQALVIQAFDKTLYASVNDTIYCLEKIDDYEKYSKNFDLDIPDIVEKKRYIPSIDHPWRIGTFNAYLNKMEHRASL